jgi:putative DNA primase/helicase
VLYDDPILAGAYGSWKTNQSYQWSCGHGEKLNPAQQKALNARIQQAKLEVQDQQNRLYKETQDKAQFIYKNALPSGHNHPYLLAKGVHSYGLTAYKSALVIPLMDQKYVVHSLQFIAPDGQKRFLKNGRKAGMFFPIGTLSQDTPKIGIAEGYATGASIYEATKMPCIVAFDIHNMVNVAKIISKTYPSAEIIICADNDTHSVDNIGVNKAKQIASLIGSKLAIAGGAS